MPPSLPAPTSHPGRVAFTLTELLIVIACLMTLTALLLPAVNVVRRQAKTTKCASNLRQIHVAMVAYASNCQGSFPAGQWGATSNQYISWDDRLADYDGRNIPLSSADANNQLDCHLSIAGTIPEKVKSYAMYTCPAEDYVLSPNTEWSRSYAYATGNFTATSDSGYTQSYKLKTTDVPTIPNCSILTRRRASSFAAAQAWNKRGAYFAVDAPPSGIYPGSNAANACDWSARTSQLTGSTILLGEIRHDRGNLGGPWGVEVDFPGIRTNGSGGPDGGLDYGSSGSVTVILGRTPRTPSQYLPLHGLKWNFLFGDGRVALMTEAETYPTTTGSVLNNLWIR